MNWLHAHIIAFMSTPTSCEILQIIILPFSFSPLLFVPVISMNYSVIIYQTTENYFVIDQTPTTYKT